MAFCNEFISNADFAKYNLAALNSPAQGASISASADAWTIDREANTWLRPSGVEVGGARLSRQEAPSPGVSVWHFCWHGRMTRLKLQLLEAGGDPGQHGWARQKLLEMEIPVDMVRFQWDIKSDLRAALNVYKDAGVRSKASTFTCILE